jgi:hypothetical protein
VFSRLKHSTVSWASLICRTVVGTQVVIDDRPLAPQVGAPMTFSTSHDNAIVACRFRAPTSDVRLSIREGFNLGKDRRAIKVCDRGRKIRHKDDFQKFREGIADVRLKGKEDLWEKTWYE